MGHLPSGPQPFWPFVEDNFSVDPGLGRWVLDDSSALHLLCTLFLLLLHQLQLRSQTLRAPEPTLSFPFKTSGNHFSYFILQTTKICLGILILYSISQILRGMEEGGFQILNKIIKDNI